MNTKKKAERKVVVFARAPNSTWARIVYGTLVSYDSKSGTAVVTNARQCLYYSRETGGEMGLAAIGPQPGSRLSGVVPGNTEIAGVGLVADCTENATSQWEKFA